LALVCIALRGLAQGELPKLQPPLGEIPPTFWEQHGTLVMIFVPVGLLLVAAGIWLRLRPKPVVAPPPAEQARAALAALARLPEDGLVISRASQVVRRHVQAEFQLPASELTTAEFCRLVQPHPELGAALAEAIAKFLHECDERKFARTSAAAPMGAVTRAVELVGEVEARRAALRQTELAGRSPAVTGSR